MKTIYVSVCTELEFGWGSKIDCYYLCEDFDILCKFIEVHGNNVGEHHSWGCSDPVEYFIEDSVVLSSIRSTLVDTDVFYIDQLRDLPFNIYEVMNK
jgi:hypothetical protein